MFGIGLSELIVIGVIALIVVGPDKLPELARQAGKLFVQFRRMSNDVRHSVEGFINQAEDEIRKEEQAALKSLLALNEPTAPPPGVADTHDKFENKTTSP